jgi:ABC-type branched-subunit amino acid transport system permease subunit
VDWGSILDNALTAAFSLEAVVFALAAIGLNVHFGYTGLLNFGQAGFMAMGAYGVGISVTYYGWSLWVGLLWASAPRSCSRSCSGSPRCGCAPTTSPS